MPDPADLKPAAPLETAPEPVSDNPAPDIIPDHQPAPPPVVDAAPAEKPRTLADERGARLRAIAQRIKGEQRGDDPVFDGDVIAAQNVGLTPEPQAPPQEPTPQAPPSAGPSDSQPPKRKLKVRGKDVELTEDEILAHAQKALAADSYFEDGRRFYEEADRAKKTATAQHPERGGREPEFAPEPTADDQHPDDPLVKALEQHAYGEDPKVVAKSLRSVIDQQVNAGARDAVVKQRMQDDLATTFMVFNKIRDENPQLFSDSVTQGALQSILHDAYAEDLRNIGIPDDRIPANPAVRTDWHRYYRVTGHNVRDSVKLLGDVKTSYERWRGGSTAQPAPSDPAKPVVSVNREQRLAAVPTAPSRSSAPVRLPEAAPQKKSREQVMTEMRAQRNRGIARSA